MRPYSKGMRLNKFIANSGYCSRRAADQLISDGKVSVNGVVTKNLGIQIDPIKDKVEVEGQPIDIDNTQTMIAFYKPRGVLSSMSTTSGASLFDFVEKMDVGRLFHVGRLDRESEGLILLTNDGDLAQKIAHPRNQVEKEYLVSLSEAVRHSDLTLLRKGIQLEDGLFRSEDCRLVSENRIQLIIHQGRNRIIRRVFEHLGYDVTQLIRLRIGHINIGELKPGKWRHLSEIEKSF